MQRIGAAAVAMVLMWPFSPAQASCPPGSTIATHVFARGLCLAVSTFGAETAGLGPVLVAVVHGDISDGGAATYHAAFARTLVRPGILPVSLIRPGYRGGDGRASGGDNFSRTDNYTRENIAAVGAAIAALRQRYGVRRTIYVGHSGGAAIGGVLVGQQPGLIDAAVLVSCPCHIARWLAESGRPPWTRSLSPHLFVHRVAKTTEIVAITGTADHNTFPAQVEDYVARLTRRGLRARFVPVEGAGHGFAGVAAATRAAVDELIDR